MSITNNDLRLAFQYWRDEFGNVLPFVLVVTIRVDNDIRPQLQTSNKAFMKCPCQPYIMSIFYNIIYTYLFSNLHCSVCASVVNNENFNLINTINSDVVYLLQSEVEFFLHYNREFEQ